MPIVVVHDGHFQLALQAEGEDFVYIVDDNIIPILGSIGRILPFRQKDFNFPSYWKFDSKQAGLYLADPTYNITVGRVLQVDFLSSSRFMSADLVKTLFIENPFAFVACENNKQPSIIIFWQKNIYYLCI